MHDRWIFFFQKWYKGWKKKPRINENCPTIHHNYYSNYWASKFIWILKQRFRMNFKMLDLSKIVVNCKNEESFPCNSFYGSDEFCGTFIMFQKMKINKDW